MSSPFAVRIGIVPTYRFWFSPWCRELLDRCVKTLGTIEGLEPVPAPAAKGDEIDSAGVPHGAVKSLDQAEFVADHFQRQKVAGIIILPLDFGDERAMSLIASRLNVPTLLFATKEPPANTDASLGRVSDSYCGTLSIAAGLYRRSLPYRFGGICFPEDKLFATEIDSFVRAVAVVGGLRGARIGQVGVRPTPFETVAFDEVQLVRKFGMSVVYKGTASLARDVQRLSPNDKKVKKQIEAIRGSAPKITVSDDHILRMAQVQCALEGFFRRERLSAMATHCWPDMGSSIGVEPCGAFGRLTDEGLLTACEADVLGALSMLVSHRSALGATVPFFIDWTIKHREKENMFLAWHCGNAPLSLACDRAKTALRSRSSMTGEPVEKDWSGGVLHQMQVKGGPVTMCRLAEFEGTWKMLIAPGRIVPSDEALAGSWAWVEVSDHDRLYRTLAENGFIHHASLIHGDQVDALRHACTFLDIEPVVVA